MPKPSVTCPGCKKHPSEGESPFWPFCSERCKMLDLGDWAAEKFRVAAKGLGPNSDEELLESKESSEDSD